MYQDFNPVYGNTCPASQPSFDSDDGLMNPQINQVRNQPVPPPIEYWRSKSTATGSYAFGQCHDLPL